MGQYRLWGKFNIQLGFMIEWKPKESITIGIPFMIIIVGLTKDAHGIGWN